MRVELKTELDNGKKGTIVMEDDSLDTRRFVEMYVLDEGGDMVGESHTIYIDDLLGMLSAFIKARDLSYESDKRLQQNEK